MKMSTILAPILLYALPLSATSTETSSKIPESVVDYFLATFDERCDLSLLESAHFHPVALAEDSFGNGLYQFTCRTGHYRKENIILRITDAGIVNPVIFEIPHIGPRRALTFQETIFLLSSSYNSETGQLKTVDTRNRAEGLYQASYFHLNLNEGPDLVKIVTDSSDDCRHNPITIDISGLTE
jgi:hypothetical protein